MFENNKITAVEGTAIPLRGNDIDTDRIIPGRYLKFVTFEGLGEYVFYDVRFDDRKHPKKHPFNEKVYQNGSILIVNKNFGCGSSREHAPQALLRFGIKTIIGESFAEIFFGNCTSLGIPAMTAPGNAIENMMLFVEEKPDTKITVDIENKTVKYSNVTIDVDIPEPSRRVLIEGKWDSMVQLLKNKAEIEETARKIPYLNW